MWHLYRPTYSGEARVRHLNDVNKRYTTSIHQQIPRDRPDVVVIQFDTLGCTCLVISTYFQPLDIHHLSERKQCNTRFCALRKLLKGELERRNNHQISSPAAVTTVTIPCGAGATYTMQYLDTLKSCSNSCISEIYDQDDLLDRQPIGHYRRRAQQARSTSC